MMTGTPIESNVWMAYLLTVFLVVTGFAVYDILYRRVPDRALVFFIPLAALAPLTDAVMVTVCGVEGVCHLTQTTWLSPAGITTSLTR